jgi:integrase
MGKSKLVEFNYVGELAGLIIDFVLSKRALGFACSTEARSLRRFAEFSLDYDLSECKLPKKLVLDWSERKLNETAETNAKRVSVLRRFALYLKERGYNVYVPTNHVITDYSSFTPYIFSNGELSSIFHTSDQLKIRNNSFSNIKATLPVILRMLYGCGLRISEAVNLRNEDVNLNEGILRINNSKFDKSRLVPMADSLTIICRSLHNRLHLYSKATQYFFTNKDGSHVSADLVYRRFRDVLWESGIPHGGRRKGPRLHDLRHTFAVHSLKMQADKGIDLYCTLPILSTYLGHSSIGATEKYVRLTKEMFPELVEKVSNACSHVIPEVKV